MARPRGGSPLSLMSAAILLPMHVARMTPSPTEPAPESVFAQLHRALVAVERLRDEGKPASIRHLLPQVGSGGSTVLPAMLLAIPFLTPVSMGPVTAPAALLIGLCALAMVSPKAPNPPERFLDITIPHAVLNAMRGGLARVNGWSARMSRPRLHGLVAGRRGQVICGLGMGLGAVLLAIPIPLLPLTNTLPALAILCFGFGWSERDGAATLIGTVALALTVVIFATLGAAAIMALGGILRG